MKNWPIEGLEIGKDLEMRRKIPNNVHLPRQLLDELNLREPKFLDAASKGRFHHGPKTSTRKAQRKASRVEKRTKSSASSSSFKSPNYSAKRTDLHKSSHTVSKLRSTSGPHPRNDANVDISRRSPQVPGGLALPQSTVSPMSEEQAEHSTVTAIQPGPRRRTRKDIYDDREIAALERALSIKKGGKKLPNSFLMDGLDELLDGIPEDFRLEGASLQENLAPRASNATAESQNNLEKLSHPRRVVSSEHRIRENPYIAPNKSTEHSPSERNEDSVTQLMSDKVDEDSLNGLRIKLRGILNKLSATNMLFVLNSIESLYQAYPRNDVTQTLIDLLLGLLCDPSSLQDTFLILHGAFIAAVTKSIGPDVGTQVLRRLVGEIEKQLVDSSREEAPDKGAANLVGILTELYNFQMIACIIIYDYIRKFVADLCERSTEILLKILRNCGPQLRQDDPSSLKEIVVLVEDSVRAHGAENLSVRIKFMIETIQNLKDNKHHRTAAVHGSSSFVAGLRMQMRKMLGNLGAGGEIAAEPLRMSLIEACESRTERTRGDLHASHSNKEPRATILYTQSPSIPLQSSGKETDLPDLLRLARAQHLNTDVRRSIFVAIMSASDYKDACDRLLKLHLKKAQVVEIPKVLVHCVAAEKIYNPYYALISSQLCADRKLKTAFKFSLWELWDRYDNDTEEGREQGNYVHPSMNSRGLAYLAKMYGQLTSEGRLELTVLKKINFGNMKPKVRIFLEILLVTVLLNADPKYQGLGRSQRHISDIFGTLSETPEVIRGLQRFIKAVIKRTEVVDEDEKESIKRNCKTASTILKDLTNALSPEH